MAEPLEEFEGEVTKVTPAAPISDEVWSESLASWIDHHVRGSAIAQTTAAWNHLHVVLPHLKEYLNRNLGRVD